MTTMRVTLCFAIVLGTGSELLSAEYWPQFRGPDGNGHSHAADVPLNWSDSENVTWKTAIHDRGWSSPVIWGDQIWLTTATADGHKLYAVCVNRVTGSVEHDVHVFDVERPPRITPSNTYASPTSVIENGRVYVHFGTHGTACLETKSGKLLWARRDLNCDHEEGAGSSPILWGDLLVVNVDGRDVQYVIALNKFTGEPVWKTKRSPDYRQVPLNQRKAYCMPIVIPRGTGSQLVSPGGKATIAYDPASGRELWNVHYDGWSIAPRPIFGHGLVFVIVDHDHPELWAIRPDGEGNVTDTHVVWKLNKGMPSRPSPLLVGDHLFLVSSDGIASCIEARTGEVIWKKRVAGKYSASPLSVGDRIYLFNENAVSTVMRAANQFEILASNALGNEQLMASPAAIGSSLFVRTEKYLYRIDSSDSK